jgi:hypothetical protein
MSLERYQKYIQQKKKKKNPVQKLKSHSNTIISLMYIENFVGVQIWAFLITKIIYPTKCKVNNSLNKQFNQEIHCAIIEIIFQHTSSSKRSLLQTCMADCG